MSGASPAPGDKPGLGCSGWWERTELHHDALLVNRCISEEGNRVIALERYRTSLRLVRDFKGETSLMVKKRGVINAFSEASKKRLRFVVLNSRPLVSQFGMSYHKTAPDGATCKKHVHVFLQAIRDNYPTMGYLWILEFQSRGVVHFHLFLTVEVNPELRTFLAETWHRIAEPESKSHLRFHRHEENFIPWDMRGGSYVCKYLDKRAQKMVPEGYGWPGRFWGTSRGLVPEPDIVMMGGLDSETRSDVVRGLCRHHESALRGKNWKSRARRTKTSCMLSKGALIVDRLIEKGGCSGKQSTA